MCQHGVCARENGFPSCAQWIFASKEAYSAVGGVEGGQWCLLMLPLRQSPMTNSPQTQEVTDAVKLSGQFWELVNPNCHQCWQGPRRTDTVSTPAGTKLSMPSQSLTVMSANISQQLLPAVPSLRRNLMLEWDVQIVWHWLSLKCYKVCSAVRKY